MINRVYRLVDTKRIEPVLREIQDDEGDVLVRPEYMSICAADRRYYFGRRKKEILKKKLPMALIHEATGTVLYDRAGKYAAGAKVVLVPLVETEKLPFVKSNYNPANPFLSSGCDGFMRDAVAAPHERLVPIEENASVAYVFTEIVSVALGAISAFEKARVTEASALGVWGDGGMGYVTALTLKCLYPEAKIFVFGKTARKLQKFSFADKTFFIDDIPRDVKIDHGFECVGGTGSEAAIGQIAELVAPQGLIPLFGVSEEPVAIPTRVVLEKGLTLIGNSRSDANDFASAVRLIRENAMCGKYLRMLISETIEVNTEDDIAYAFEQDALNDFKTVIKWTI
jgi:ribitol-5-phosphate 2-dehydrogenase